MQYYMPVKVYEEENCVQKRSSELCAVGSRALLVTGRNSARVNGSLGDVTDALEEGGVTYVLFDAVEENPSVETVMRARELGLLEKADFVIGIGGGSALDAAKAAALMLAHPGEGADYLYDAAKAKASVHLPLVLIPTTCGTGSEVTGVSVLTLHARKTKSSLPHKIFADLALIDGKYLAAAPAHIIRNTAVDALGHLLESYYNSSATPYSRMCADAGLLAWSKVRRPLLELDEHALTKEECMQLMRASAFAGMAIAQTGTSLPHALSYALTYDLHLPHGVAVGLFEAGYLRALPADRQLTALEMAGFASIEEWEEFFHIVCGELVLPKEELQHTIDMVASNPSKLAKAPFECTREVLERIALR